MSKKIAILANYPRSSFGCQLHFKQVCTIANAASSKFDVTLVVWSSCLEQAKKIASSKVKLVVIDNAKVQKTNYVVDLDEVKKVCGSLDADYAIAYGSSMDSQFAVKSELQRKKGGGVFSKNIIHTRFNNALMGVYLPIAALKCFLCVAKEKSMYRVIDYWEAADYTKLCGREVKLLGLYDDPNFQNGDFKAKMKYFPDIDWYKYVFEKVQMPEKKTRLFTFGYKLASTTKKFRSKQLAEFLDTKVEDSPRDKIFVYRKVVNNDGKTLDNTVPLQTYLAYISQSKFTLVIPSTLMSEVSVNRVNESIRRKCIPLFTPDNNIEKVYTKHDVDFIRSKLVFDPAKWKDINEWVKSLESQYYTLLEEVEALDFVKAGYALTENDIVEAIENA